MMTNRTVRVGAVVTAAVVWMATATPVRAQSSFDPNGQCVGDKNGDGQVTVDEILTAVNSALGSCQFTSVTLQFRAAINSDTFACGTTYHNVGTTNADIVPSDFRFYIHNIRLVTADQREVKLKLQQDQIWQIDDITLMDFENKVRPCNDGTTDTNTTVRGMIEPGTYTGVRFTLGVPFTRNHADQSIAPSPLNLSGMFWSWEDGYKFLRIDTAFDNLRVHLGSIGCFDTTPGVIGGCTRMNLAEIDLDHFDASTNTIVADLGALLADYDVNSNQPDTAPGCMSDPGDNDCNPIFRNLGLNFSDGTVTPGTQKFFRVE